MRVHITRDLGVEQPPGALNDQELVNLFAGGDPQRYSRQRQYRQVPLGDGRVATESTETVTIDGDPGGRVLYVPQRARVSTRGLGAALSTAIGCLTLTVGVITLPVLGYWLAGSRPEGAFLGLGVWCLWALGSMCRRK